MTKPVSMKKWVGEYADEYGERLLTMDGFDDCILGIASIHSKPPFVVYNSRAVVARLVERDGMTQEEAEEYFAFNMECAYLGEGTPAFLRTPEEEE